MKILQAATYAPSAKNRQNWHFVVIEDQHKIINLAKAICNKANEYIERLDNKDMRENLQKMIPYFTVFKNAPVLIIVYAKDYGNDEVDMLKYLKEDEDKIRKCLFTNSPIQNVSAAMENLMLRENNTTKKKVTSGSSYIFIKIYFI